MTYHRSIFVSEAAPLLLFGFTVAAGADAGISAELLLVLNQFEAFAETMYINNPIINPIIARPATFIINFPGCLFCRRLLNSLPS